MYNAQLLLISKIFFLLLSVRTACKTAYKYKYNQIQKDTCDALHTVRTRVHDSRYGPNYKIYCVRYYNLQVDIVTGMRYKAACGPGNIRTIRHECKIEDIWHTLKNLNWGKYEWAVNMPKTQIDQWSNKPAHLNTFWRICSESHKLRSILR